MRESSRAFISHQAQCEGQFAIKEISEANQKLIHTRSNVISSGRWTGDMLTAREQTEHEKNAERN